MSGERIDYKHLRDETLRMLDAIESAHSSAGHDGNPYVTAEVEAELVDLWKGLPLKQNKPAELDVQVGSETYPNSKYTVTYLILYYLLENDCSDVVERFIAESKDEEDQLVRIRDNYNEFRKIIKEIEQDTLNLLEEFVREGNLGGDLELHLTCHKFLLLIYSGKYDEALRVCLGGLKVFMPRYIDDVKPILKFLINPTNIQEALGQNRQKLMEKFKCKYRESNEMPNKCYLRELFDTGTSAFLQLSGSGNLFFDKDDTTLPVEIKISRGSNYHSLFVCPVLKTLCVGNNGPVMLECGHVISSNAATVLSKEGTLNSFKCPYCPEMSKYERVLELKF